MKWLLTLLCVNSLIAVVLYPMIALGVAAPISWLLETGFLVTGVGALYLLVRYRKSL